MFPKRLPICALVATLALLVVGCSSGEKQSAATTTTKVPLSTEVTSPVSAGRLGALTGFLLPCAGNGTKSGNVRYAAGEVIVARPYRVTGHGLSRDAHVATNHRFRFALPQGRYEVIAVYGAGGVPQSPTYEATVRAGKTLGLDVGARCT
jgi:hypothetical protein